MAENEAHRLATIETERDRDNGEEDKADDLQTQNGIVHVPSDDDERPSQVIFVTYRF